MEARNLAQKSCVCIYWTHHRILRGVCCCERHQMLRDSTAVVSGVKRNSWGPALGANGATSRGQHDCSGWGSLIATNKKHRVKARLRINVLLFNVAAIRGKVPDCLLRVAQRPLGSARTLPPDTAIVETLFGSIFVFRENWCSFAAFITRL